MRLRSLSLFAIGIDRRALNHFWNANDGWHDSARVSGPLRNSAVHLADLLRCPGIQDMGNDLARIAGLPPRRPHQGNRNSQTLGRRLW